MANQEHLEILKQGVEVWNNWVKLHPEVHPNFFGADLRGTDLSKADLSYGDFYEANLSGAQCKIAILRGAHFRGANLYGAELAYADLSGASLYEVNLKGTNLWGANLSGARLKGASLSHAKLSEAHFNGADLTKADFTKASVGWTIFGNIDLSTVKGLETVEHQGPSTIGIDTIYRSQGNIPEVFLKGAGVDDTFITYARSLVGKPIDYYTCFISYSSKDESFANRLYADLQSSNVRCWFAPEDLKIGDKFRHRIDESIRMYDKLLIVLSEASLASTWVGYEVEKALDKEPEGKPNVLFPIRLDKAILTCETDWAKDIRKSRHIGDFENWKDHDAYQVAFKRLLRDLKAQS